MLRRETINKMNEDELKNYLYQLQNYTEVVREINFKREAIEENLICLLHQRKDLSILTTRENNKANQLLRLTEEMEGKYLSTCSSKENTIWGSDVYYESEE